MVKKASRARPGLLRVPRRCAATAASRIKLMSDAEEDRVDHEYTGSRIARRKPLHVACAAAQKIDSDSEGDVNCEVPNEQSGCEGQPPDANSEGSTKSISHSLNEDSDSEGVLDSGHKNRRTRSLKTSVAPSKTKNALIVSLEEDSKSHIPRGEIGRKCSSESTLVHKATAETNFEVERQEAPDLWEGSFQ